MSEERVLNKVKDLGPCAVCDGPAEDHLTGGVNGDSINFWLCKECAPGYFDTLEQNFIQDMKVELLGRKLKTCYRS